eukprot:1096499-Amorphochlora_amoeboformis.AAC.1
MNKGQDWYQRERERGIWNTDEGRHVSKREEKRVIRTEGGKEWRGDIYWFGFQTAFILLNASLSVS